MLSLILKTLLYCSMMAISESEIGIRMRRVHSFLKCTFSDGDHNASAAAGIPAIGGGERRGDGDGIVPPGKPCV